MRACKARVSVSRGVSACVCERKGTQGDGERRDATVHAVTRRREKQELCFSLSLSLTLSLFPASPPQLESRVFQGCCWYFRHLISWLLCHGQRKRDLPLATPRPPASTTRRLDDARECLCLTHRHSLRRLASFFADTKAREHTHTFTRSAPLMPVPRDSSLSLPLSFSIPSVIVLHE